MGLAEAVEGVGGGRSEAVLVFITYPFIAGPVFR
jgi:hypothetical protein